jgi:hypothetical protein
LRRPTIILQNTDRSFCRFITKHEMERLLRQKEAVRVSKRKNPRIAIRLIPQPVSLRSMHEASTPSITAADIEAYVGIGDDGAVYVARKKVNEYRKVSPRHILKPA